MDLLVLNPHDDYPERMSIVDLLTILKGQSIHDHVVDDLTDLLAEGYHLAKGRPLSARCQRVPIAKN